MNRNKSHILGGCRTSCIVLWCCFWGFSGWAQKSEKKPWRQGKRMEDIEVEIVRERQITLPVANRNFEKIPPRSDELDKPALSYSFKKLVFTPPAYSFSIRPMRLKKEPISKLYGNCLSVGFGNYLSPYLEGWFNSKRSEKHLYGAHIYHRSAFLGPVDEDNSATFDSYFKTFGSLYGRVISGRARITYENRVGYFYGYTPGTKVDRDTLRQIYHVAAAEASITNTKTSPLNFTLSTGFSYLVDNYKTKEGEFSVNFDGNYVLSEKSKILFTSDYFLIDREDESKKRALRHLLKLKPVFEFRPIENLLLRAGVNAIIQNDTIHGGQFHIYPDATLQYTPIKNLHAYLSIKGDFDKISLHTLSAENFWVNTDLDIFHTDRSYEFLVGLKGRLGRRVNLEAGFSRVGLTALYMYKNATDDKTKFDVVYDDVEQLNFFAVASYEKNKRIVLTSRVDYFHYNAERVARPWHKPQYQVTLDAFFDIYNKININLNFTGRGGLYGFDNQVSKAVELDPALDLNLRVDYFLSKPFSLFLKLENILYNSYPLYFNYKSRGFQLLAGINWSF